MDLLTTKHTRNTKKVSKNKSSHSALEHPQVKIQQQAIFDSAPKQYPGSFIIGAQLRINTETGSFVFS